MISWGIPWEVSQLLMLTTGDTNLSPTYILFIYEGSILQQILVTPSLPFTIPHAILTATTTKAPRGDPAFINFIMNPTPPPPNATPQQRRQHALDTSRRMTEFGYDPEWLKVEKNRQLVESKLEFQIKGRPASIISAQAQAVSVTP